MRLDSTRALLLTGIAVGAITALATGLWLSGQTATRQGDSALATPEPTPANVTRVVVASGPISAGAELTALQLRYAEFPVEVVPDGAFAEVDSVIGRVAQYPISHNSPVLDGALVGGEDAAGSGLTFSIPPGYRAVSAPFSELMGAGGLVVPGDRVDVLVATTYGRLFEPGQVLGEDESANHPAVLTILQDVLVVAVGQEISGPAFADSDPSALRATETEPQPAAASLTLAVTAEQAQKLFFASQEGSLGFALRSFGDGARPVLAPELKVEPAGVLNVSR